MIIGRDLLKELGIVLISKNETILWGDGEIPMKTRDATVETSFFIDELTGLAEEANHMSKILDVKYSKANIKKVAAKTKGLRTKQSQKLEAILRRHKSLFNGTLRTWKDTEYHIELEPHAQPSHAKPYLALQSYKEMFHRKVDQLGKVGVLKKVNRSKWAAPTFIVPKMDGTVCFIKIFVN